MAFEAAVGSLRELVKPETVALLRSAEGMAEHPELTAALAVVVAVYGIQQKVGTDLSTHDVSTSARAPPLPPPMVKLPGSALASPTCSTHTLNSAPKLTVAVEPIGLCVFDLTETISAYELVSSAVDPSSHYPPDTKNRPLPPGSSLSNQNVT
jgi:hypothetical protein